MKVAKMILPKLITITIDFYDVDSVISKTPKF